MTRGVALALALSVSLPAAALSVEKVGVLEPIADGTRLTAPVALCHDGFRDMLVVADTEGDRILVLDRQGGVRKVLGREGDGLRRPVAVAVTRGGVLYVAEHDSEALKVRVAYDSADPEEFQTIDLAPHRGSRPVEPVALHAAPGGLLYVADRANRQVLVLAADGSLLRSIDRVGEPSDVWADGRQTLVADPSFGRIQVYDADGEWSRTVGDSPSRSPQPVQPKAVLVDRRGRIWTVEENGEIRVMDVIGNRLLTLPAGELLTPEDVVLDRDGTLYILERGGNRIAVYRVTES